MDIPVYERLKPYFENERVWVKIIACPNIPKANWPRNCSV